MADVSTTLFFEKPENMTNEPTETVSTNATSPLIPSYLEFYNWINDEAEKLPYYKAAFVFKVGYFYVLPIVALVCNFLTVGTMMRLKPFTSTSLYICSLAIADTLVLFLRSLSEMVEDFDLQLGDYGCGVLTFVLNLMVHVAVWTIVVMTLERFVAVVYPLHVTALFTMKKTKLSIAMLYVVFSLIDAHFIYTYSMGYTDSRHSGYYCRHRPGTTFWSYNIWFWLNSALFAIIPCSSLLILNIVIIVGMRSSLKKQKRMVLDDSGKKDAQQRQVTVMLLSMSFAYIVFFVPVSIYMVASIGFNVYESPEILAWFMFVTRVVFFFSSLNHAVNFVFYFASNSRFRVALVQFLKCQKVSAKKVVKVKTGDSTVNTVSSGVSSTGNQANGTHSADNGEASQSCTNPNHTLPNSNGLNHSLNRAGETSHSTSQSQPSALESSRL
ncbi:allatostatin-A receptor-like [Liolophura sinensis]|uniref:allatostatin-A receptor-like n=1 Tax=Liolophura sinensis TaxID=3198878 RepID=UPI0031581772